MGILFGYGARNAQTFAERLQQGDNFERFEFSTAKEIERFKASKRNFSIPIFRTLENEEIVRIYQQEHEKIKEIYRKGDALEITLKKLTGTLPQIN